ncbi:MBL fold metallo-hydrolase [Kocuria sp. cx-455]|uniref:MBL fold metallo-hydrolase n=1 Tax=Kocuria sp. cx-455 TaxID=2771377 RepID=UPI003D762F8F
MHVVTLGTSGGPLLRPRPAKGSAGAGHTGGIATAVVVEDRYYLVDAGHGVAHALVNAGLKITDLRGVFITHHHSDHTIDLNSLMVLGGLAFRGRADITVPVIGPGDRGEIPPVGYRTEQAVAPIFGDEPTPGTRRAVELLLRAHATDLNDRRRDSRAPDISAIFVGRDIALPERVGFHPDRNNHPEMEPFEVFRDEHVVVTATLVQHQPMAPAFAFRFDSAEGSVTVSGDTAPSQNLVRLATDCDLLLHEAIDLDAVARSYGAVRAEDLEASMGHHRRAHTTPQDTGRIAREAGVKRLALHHLVPAGSPESGWRQAETTYPGPVLIPRDLEVIALSQR